MIKLSEQYTIFEKVGNLNTTKLWFLTQADFFGELQKKFKWSAKKLNDKVLKLGKYFYLIADKLSRIPTFEEFIKYVTKKDSKVLAESMNDETKLLEYIYWENVTALESLFKEEIEK